MKDILIGFVVLGIAVAVFVVGEWLRRRAWRNRH
jgi:hypothetical protein